MKKGIHPENYRPVVFKDMSNGDMFLSKSTEEVNNIHNRLKSASKVVAYASGALFLAIYLLMPNKMPIFVPAETIHYL